MENLSKPKGPEQYYKDLVHAMPQGYVCLRVEFDEQQKPVDLYCLEANAAALRILGTGLVGKRTSDFHSRHTQHVMEISGRVVRTGTSERHEVSAGLTDTYFEFSVIKAGLSEEPLVAVIFEDSAKRHRDFTIKAIDRYLALFNSIQQGFCIIEVLFDKNSTAIDYRFLEVNPAFEAETGLRNVVGKTMRELVPHAENHWFQTYGEVALTGISRHFDERSTSLGRWFDVYAFRIDEPWKHRVAMLFNDMSERKNAEEAYKATLEREVKLRTAELKESRDLLGSILDTTLIAMSLMEAVRDEQGNIIDFRIRVANKQLEKQTGRTDLIGKLYAAEYPGIKLTGIFETMLRVMQTGEPQGFEYFYPYEGLNRWFSCMFVKIDDGIAATNLDISKRKQAEEGRLRNYVLLQQSEELAEMGSWEYQPQTDKLSWSHGMYRLFGVNEGACISSDIYVRNVTDSSRLAAEQMLNFLRSGKETFEKTLDITVAGQRKTFHFKAIAVQPLADHPGRILGVTIDITSSRRVEEKIRQMEETQQREIFRVTLDTQEEERRRISESLHNGLGQVLYAIKISMNNLTFNSANEKQEEFHQAKKYTEDLLADAIKSTRHISHTLSPTILEDFGLKAAIKAICDQLDGEVKFRCKVVLESTPIDRFLELAVFRTVQELLSNVAKHANATDAYTEVSGNDNDVMIVVQDNGTGFDVKKKRKGGIGLTSIRSKVKLLKGSFSITSTPDSGTTVKVRLPVYKLNK